MAERNDDLRHVWEFVEHTGKHIFLTGKAGTGKTTFLRYVVGHTTKRVVVTAPTGVAAIHAGGVTLHSFFQLPLSPYVPQSRIHVRNEMRKEKRKMLRTLDLLVIDEISMVRSDTLDALDAVLRRYRDASKPFGGVQLLMIGDLGQLTPVTTPEDERLLRPFYDSYYFFGSHALAQTDYVTIELQEVYRQQDPTFVGLLNHVREGCATASDIEMLNRCYRPQFIPRRDEGYIRLTTHNISADRYNEAQLQSLPSPAHHFAARVEGTFPDLLFPTGSDLTLKEGAQVMFIKNDPTPSHSYYNGKIGHVSRISDKGVEVTCSDDGMVVNVEPQVWENTHYKLNAETREIESEIQGTFTQLPLRLAWSITIHKSQGLTFEHAIIEANASFAPGQVYVALSRCRSLSGIVLAAPLLPRAIISDPQVNQYVHRQQEASSASVRQLPTLKEEYYAQLLTELFSFQSLGRAEERMSRLFIEHFSHQYPQLTLRHKEAVKSMQEKVTDVAYRWCQVILQTAVADRHSPEFLSRVQRSAAYFSDNVKSIFSTMLAAMLGVKSGNKELMKRFSNYLAELRESYYSKQRLLTLISQEGYTVSGYLKGKQRIMMQVLDEGEPERKSRCRRPRDRQSRHVEKKGPTLNRI